MASNREKRSFAFIKSRVGAKNREQKRQHREGEESVPTALGRWFRELRPGRESRNIDRGNPVYHSEGKGLRKRKDRRRHSFNEREDLTAKVSDTEPLVRSRKCQQASCSDHHINSAAANGLERQEEVTSHGVEGPRCSEASVVTPFQPMGVHQDVRTIMSAKSTPNLGHEPEDPLGSRKSSIYSYLHNKSGLNFAPVVGGHPYWERQDSGGEEYAAHVRSSSYLVLGHQGHSRSEGGSPPLPPVRDVSSLKYVKYGPGHEKFPSWPVPAGADTPAGLKSSGGGSHRSKSWTEQTNYPKEKATAYTRPYMKRPNPAFTQQLKTVLEKCEKIPPEAFESKFSDDDSLLSQPKTYLPRLDREGKSIGDQDYMVPSPPERDMSKPQLTQADLEEYARTFDENLQPYAHSEGYHSYVSSDSLTTTPFLDRLRRDSESGQLWVGADEPERDRPGRESVATVGTTSSSSASSSETLKWHGSMSDVSVASGPARKTEQLIAHSARVQTPQRHHSESVLYLGSRPSRGWQERVHHNNQLNNKLKMFPVSTYTVQPCGQEPSPKSPPVQTMSVAERIHELERQQARTKQDKDLGGWRGQDKKMSSSQETLRGYVEMDNRYQQQQPADLSYTYLDPDKRHKVSDPTLKAIQKKALLSYYERHAGSGRGVARLGRVPDEGSHPDQEQSGVWKSEPQLAHQARLSSDRVHDDHASSASTSRRSSSASDYVISPVRERPPFSIWRETSNEMTGRELVNSESAVRDGPRHEHSANTPPRNLVGPLIVGPPISVDDWVPERPPKKPHLRAAFNVPKADCPPPIPPPPRAPCTTERELRRIEESARELRNLSRCSSPDLPPPSPPPVVEDEVFISDEPLPPPPPQVQLENRSVNHERGSPNHYEQVFPVCQDSRIRHHEESATPQDRRLMNGVPNGSSTHEPLSRTNHEPCTRQGHHGHHHHPAASWPVNHDANHGWPGSHRESSKHSGHLERYSPKPSSQDLLLAFPLDSRNERRRCSPTNDPRSLPGHGFADGRPMTPHDPRLQRSPKNSSANTFTFAQSELKMHRSESRMANQVQLNTAHLRDPRSFNGAKYDVRSQSDTKLLALGRNDPGSKSITQTRSDSRLPFYAPKSPPTCYAEPRSPPADSRFHYGLGETVVVSHAHSRSDCRALTHTNSDPRLIHSPTLKEARSLAHSDTNLVRCPTIGDLGPCARPQERHRRPDGFSATSHHSSRDDRERKISSSSMPAELRLTRSQTELHLNETGRSEQDASMTQSKASYLAYKRERERGLPNFEGSYKRTISPTDQIVIESSGSQLSEWDQLPNPLPVNVAGPSPPTTPSSEKSEKASNSLDDTSSIDSENVSEGLQVQAASQQEIESTVNNEKDLPSVLVINNNNSNNTNNNVPCPDSDQNLNTVLEESVGNTRTTDKSVVTVEKSHVLVTCSSPVLQRSEVILKVNATSDAASQTDKDPDEECDIAPVDDDKCEDATEVPKENSVVEPVEDQKPSNLFIRQKLQEEIECEQLSRDLASRLPPSDKLQGLLAADQKKSTDYVTGLFKLDISMRPRSQSKFQAQSQQTSLNHVDSTVTQPSNESTQEKSRSNNTTVPLPANSAYFTTSESKAKFLTTYGKDMNDPELKDMQDSKDLQQKKEELMSRLDRKLEVLRSEQLVVREEVQLNDDLGRSVTAQVQQLASPNELSKFKLHIEEIGKITSLLLALSGRLARAESALMVLPEEAHHEERSILEGKRDKLKDQLEEAKKLKESIDKRSVNVSNILYKYLNAEEYADYDHFINMKAKLIMDSREIADKIKLGEEQLAALKETLSMPS